MPSRSLLASLCVAGVTAVFSAGQSSPAAPSGQAAPTQTPSPAAPAATPVIRTQANLVLVDVVVTDQNKPVQGLTAARFHILENGKDQHISTFEEHRAADSQQVGQAPALPPGVYSNYPQFAIASAANVLLLDALNTPISDQAYVRQQMLAYLKRIPPGTRIAVFTLASRLRMIEGFTTDAGAIQAAISQGKGSPQQSALLESPQEQDEMNDTATSMSGVDGGALQQFVSDMQSFQTDIRVRMTLDALAQLGRYLGAVPGRKNLIWFSGSFPLQIDPDASQSPTSGSSPLDPFSPMRNYSDEVKQTDSLLSAARVAVYPVDARGLMSLPSTDASRAFNTSQSMPSMSSAAPPSRHGGRSGSTGGSAGAPSGQTPAQKADAAFFASTINEHQTMNQIAQETGGQAFYDDNGIKEAVALAIANGSNYYTVGYVPDARNFDGAFRSIRLQVDGAKYELAYRRGYYAVDPAKPSAENPGLTSPIVAAIQRGAPPLSQIVFEARVLDAADPAAKERQVAAGPAGELAQGLKPPVRRYFVDISADPRKLTWSALAGNGAHGEIEITMVAWDPDGKRVNFTDRGLGVNLTAEQSAQIVRSGLPLHEEIDLPAGDVYLRIAVRDIASGRIGSMEIPLRVPKA
jgi:VWFA-related protein